MKSSQLIEKARRSASLARIRANQRLMYGGADGADGVADEDSIETAVNDAINRARQAAQRQELEEYKQGQEQEQEGGDKNFYYIKEKAKLINNQLSLPTDVRSVRKTMNHLRTHKAFAKVSGQPIGTYFRGSPIQAARKVVRAANKAGMSFPGAIMLVEVTKGVRNYHGKQYVRHYWIDMEPIEAPETRVGDFVGSFSYKPIAIPRKLIGKNYATYEQSLEQKRLLAQKLASSPKVIRNRQQLASMNVKGATRPKRIMPQIKDTRVRSMDLREKARVAAKTIRKARRTQKAELLAGRHRDPPVAGSKRKQGRITKKH
jgi:flavin-binding protein dodecin